MDPPRFLMQRPVSDQGTGSHSTRPLTAVSSGEAARDLEIVRTAPALRARVQDARRAGLTIGLVPTMGSLHEGHLSLIRRARERCGLVVVSLFVNPTQFDEAADLSAYPRSEPHDAQLARDAGADLLFAPSVEEVYPQGCATSVEVSGVGARLEGEIRSSGHFRGVATVVTKLFNMATPDLAFFGEKDAQQLVVIRRLVRDLDMPIEIEACPTVREPDGLAMSSRNARLNADERSRAVALQRALAAAGARAAAGERDANVLADAATATMAAFSVRPDYVELVDPDTLETLPALDRRALLLVAARVGETRLIDNAILEPAAGSHSCQALGTEAVLCSA
jgi:pantoate--beta-alanine ligase